MKDDGQMTLEAALAEKEQVLDLVTLNNEGFVKTMRKIAVDLARASGSVTSDDLRVLCRRWGIAPSHPNVWGAIFRGSGWRVLDRRASTFEGNHAREIKVWGIK